MTKTCAIHQPNFFPRISTLAKLYAADTWVVLDDVQFARRDYQHRCRLAKLDDFSDNQWLSLRVRRPHGLDTKIDQVQLLEPEKCQQRTEQMIRQLYGKSIYWEEFETSFNAIVSLFNTTDSVAKIAEVSTLAMLERLGWQGEVVRSSDINARAGRSERLADLAKATGADVYLCGTGGAKYIDESVFSRHEVAVEYFYPPYGWLGERNSSSLWALMTHGPEKLRLLLDEKPW